MQDLKEAVRSWARAGLKGSPGRAPGSGGGFFGRQGGRRCQGRLGQLLGGLPPVLVFGRELPVPVCAQLPAQGPALIRHWRSTNSLLFYMVGFSDHCRLNSAPLRQQFLARRM